MSATHRAHVERSAAGYYYATCSRLDCDWHSRRHSSETHALDAARKHERDFATGNRFCPECGSLEINETEAVCLACSNRAWSDR